MRKKGRGFTLIELIIVVVIIGILAVVAIPQYYANIEKARRAEAYSTLSAMRQAELAYYATQSPPVYKIAWPITATMDGDTVVNLVQPSSPNFTYSMNTVADPCLVATAVTGTTNYSMKTSTGAVYATGTCS